MDTTFGNAPAMEDAAAGPFSPHAVALPCQRQLFDLPEHVTYLNCASSAPLLRATRLAGEAAVSRKSRPWETMPADYFDEPEQVRELFGRLCHADADGVALIPSVTYGMATAAANLTVGKGQEIVVLAEQFPSNVYPWRVLAEAQGARIVTVPRPGNHDWTSAILEHLTPRTALVALPQCHWTDGGLVDLAGIGAAARTFGAALVIDATQSLGAYPLDVAAIQPDFLITATYKWLLGPYSMGMMWVAPKYRQGRPIEHSWLNRADSHDFARLVDYRDDFLPGARRYDVGERANPIQLPMAISALQQLLDWGVERIAATTAGLTDALEHAAQELGWEATPAKYRGRHMIGIRMPQGPPKDLITRLAASGIYVSVRGDSLRVSPHVYNTREDVERLIQALQQTC